MVLQPAAPAPRQRIGLPVCDSDTMTRNIYDDATFFSGYSRLPRSVSGLDGAPEWPSLRALVPNLRGRRVLDLGCGFGWFCRWAAAQGARHVTGIDVSERMLARAVAETAAGVVTYRQADLEHLSLAGGSFDFVYSSLAFHYISHLEALFGQVHGALLGTGRLVFSVEHPVFTAPTRPEWQVDTEGRRTWSLDGYLDEGPRSTMWLGARVIKQHRTLGTYLALLRQTGFELEHLEEWGPDDAQLAADPSLGDERRRPTFMIVAARRIDRSTMPDDM